MMWYDMMMLPAQVDVPVSWASVKTLLFEGGRFVPQFLISVHPPFLPSSPTSVSYLIFPPHPLFRILNALSSYKFFCSLLKCQ